MRAAGSNPATDPALFHLTTTNRGWFVEGLFAVENWDTNLENFKGAYAGTKRKQLHLLELSFPQELQSTQRIDESTTTQSLNTTLLI
jgi:hypothetical protein